MIHSLYYKFILGYLIFGLLGFATIATFSSNMTYDYLVEQKTESLYDEASLIAKNCSNVYQGKSLDLEAVKPQIEAMASYLQSEIWIINHKGTVIADSSHRMTGKAIDGFDPTERGNKSYSIGTYYGNFSSEVISVSAPITGNFNTYGYIVIHMPLNLVTAEQNNILNIVYITSAILFGLSLLILLFFTQTVYFPLKKITRAATEYAAGNLTYTTSLHTQDEMGYLANTLNYMAMELNKMEEYQHKFIANVSHDFRSPLTSIKGYLEAIIDGTIPVELYEKYLNIVIAETERLNKLTQGMLTLNSLDSRGFLTRTNFDINRMIKDTAAAFEGVCNTKGITFELTFNDSIQMVYADLEKIQQVLYNLIDNAIKFSHEDSVIYLQASEKHEKIFVSVKDTGSGIPKDSIKKIWERFYKSDPSRGKDKKGTGLGLSIVKEIIQAHDENIDVVSTEGVGTEFIFSLPKASNL